MTDSIPLSPQPAFTGQTINFVYRNAVNQVWNTTGTPAFENWTDAHYNAGDYNVAATEQGTSAEYQATTPSGIVVPYTFGAYKHVGGTISTDVFVGGSMLPCGYQAFANSVANPASTLATNNDKTGYSGDAATIGGQVPVQTAGKLWVLDGNGDAIAPASTALSTGIWTGTLATNLSTTNAIVATNLDAEVSQTATQASLNAKIGTNLTYTDGLPNVFTVMETVPGLSGTASAGGASTITLDGTASSATGIYVGQLIVINLGTANQQVRKIVQYASNIVTVDFPWIAPAPSAGTPYLLPGINPQSITIVNPTSNQVIVNGNP